ncbi:hypothetical protein C8F04DRAFT_1105005 [Mycena alexandri]|uniref:Uncharacterized protein n=1 Tax=Mycena alexandri TaxID=1745969 RepID=A0AAD6SWV2_9AGAR|nr:hypothetical protein C8F04DRAFT_1167019 [Mycena alexandri]KAJ7019149.1 hypothetical protein C8F04DRAFT_1148773 [Mycena alexandri]KAJ7031464.1 hypothetical protein C8F04DRAFT_1110338 [Mycena alexandri]KAJ7033252.1 hypothetical protein C8F04DRAFT_1105005 [Mycena alexandri]
MSENHPTTMQSSPRKTLAEWKLARSQNPHPQPPPQPQLRASEGLADVQPHRVDILRNRQLGTSLGPFDGNVGAYAQLGARHYFITTNTDYVPALPSLEIPHRVYLRSDMRYGTDDPTLWPQQWTDHYCHMPLIAKKGTRADLASMWWDPSPQDFIVGSAVTRGLGRLQPRRITPILDVVNMVVRRCTELRDTSRERLHPLFGELIQHILMWLEQLQTLPTTYPKMLFALTSLQREVLELDALYEYLTIYKTRMSNYLTATVPGVAQCVGAFTTLPMVAQQLWAAGVPFWLLRPLEVFDEENILRVVPLLEPSFGLPDGDAHGAGAPPVLYSGNSTVEKIGAIHSAALHTPWYHDPFETGFSRAPSPSPAPVVPVASTSRSILPPPMPRNHLLQQQERRYKPYAAKDSPKASAKKGAVKVQRDKFTRLDILEMPPAIVSMATALAQVDRGIVPYTSNDTDKRYILPEPALLVHTAPERRRHKFLYHWTLLADGFIYMLTRQPQLLRPQEWRDLLEGLIEERGAPGSKTQRRSAKLQDLIRPALEASNVTTISNFPASLESVPEFSLARTREIVWQVAETSFRFEFSSLDKRASGRDRLDEVKRCFAGHMLIGAPLEMSTQGWASTSVEERHRYVARTAALMLAWTTKSNRPNIIRRVAERHLWSPAEMENLETAVCRYYTQAFWEYFGRAAVVPLRLDHELEREEGEI